METRPFPASKIAPKILSPSLKWKLGSRMPRTNGRTGHHDLSQRMNATKYKYYHDVIKALHREDTTLTRSIHSKLNRNQFSEPEFYALYESFDHTTKPSHREDTTNALSSRQRTPTFTSTSRGYD